MLSIFVNMGSQLDEFPPVFPSPCIDDFLDETLRMISHSIYRFIVFLNRTFGELYPYTYIPMIATIDILSIFKNTIHYIHS